MSDNEFIEKNTIYEDEIPFMKMKNQKEYLTKRSIKNNLLKIEF